MCDLCVDDEETRDGERARLINVSGRLRRLAMDYEGLAAGRIAPHGEDGRHVALRAKSLIKELFNDWI